MHNGSTSEHMFIYTVKITVLIFVLHISTADVLLKPRLLL